MWLVNYGWFNNSYLYYLILGSGGHKATQRDYENRARSNAFTVDCTKSGG